MRGFHAFHRRLAPSLDHRPPKPIDWLRGPMIEAWGKPAVEGMEAAHFAGASLDLTAKGDQQAVAAAVGGTVLPTGSVRTEPVGKTVPPTAAATAC